MEITRISGHIHNGASSFTHVEYGPRELPRDEGVTAVLVPGWVGGIATCAGLAQGLAEAAGGNLRVVAYDEPLVGTGAYAQDYRVERLQQVVQAQRAPHVLAIGHSRGWLTVADAAVGLHEDGKLHSAAGLTPMGGHVLPAWRTVLGVAGEILTGPFATSPRHNGLRSIGTVGAVVGRGLTHLAAHPIAAGRQLGETFGADMLIQTAAISRRLPTLMVSGGRDFVVPPRLLRARLQEAGYEGQHYRLPVSHVGALVDYSQAGNLYKGLQRILPADQGVMDGLPDSTVASA